MKMRCPNCRKVIINALMEQGRREKFYPFCSQRCKWVDLGRWLDENYRIVSGPKNEELDYNDNVENSEQSERKGR